MSLTFYMKGKTETSSAYVDKLPKGIHKLKKIKRSVVGRRLENYPMVCETSKF